MKNILKEYLKGIFLKWKIFNGKFCLGLFEIWIKGLFIMCVIFIEL